MEAFLIFIGILLLVHWIEYRNSIQEYSVTQVPVDELAGVLREKTPVMVEIGLLPWRPEITQEASWVIETQNGPVDPKIWVTAVEPISNKEDLANQLELVTGLSDIDSARSLWWLPGLFHTSVDILKGEITELSWITAERHWIGCTSGAPLTVWLVHSRYRRFLPETVADPWTLTVAEAPYIGRVQYIEVRIQPGWCLGLPSHWGYAIRSDDTSWFWSVEQHSLFSLGVTHVNDHVSRA